ncbi:uncharacterized protein BDZ99DRAFT_570090 [Mytilinidion resinicola]|uniref:Mid2 domain-containing protein n=1 Tax=Mytilinidion resinicola TaxID=574789 RepID=A0A6A6YPG7_9PEZI|nr:uncharacterized protein BDZ99DRAFT_570090 [Mytilinidion resinicola]KAF2810772.1 hypothetical protein BDZ99DRAFT_570090 [Mytilinidion resinicola]
MHHPLLSSPIFSLAITLFAIPAIRASCYYPDGSFPTDYAYEACTGDQFSSCCIPAEGDLCLSNGLCQFGKGGYVFRGACSDKNWNSPNCFQHCKQGDYAANWQRVVSCGGNRYCCYSSESICCNDDTQVFEVADGTVVNDYTSLTPEATQPLTGAASSATGAVVTTAVNGFQTTATSRTTSSTSSPTASSHPASSVFQNNKVPIIAGIAGGIAVIFALTVGYKCARRRYRRRNAMLPVPPYNPPQTSFNPRPASVSSSSRAVSPASPPQWQNDPAKMTPWAAATPVPPQTPTPPLQGRTPEPNPYNQHGGVVYEAQGTPAPTRYEVPGQTRPIYEVPGQTQSVYEAPGQTRPLYEAPGQTRQMYEAP